MRDNFYHYLKKKIRVAFLAQILATILYQPWLVYYQLQKAWALTGRRSELPTSQKARERLAQQYYARTPVKEQVQRHWSAPTVSLSILMEVNDAEPFLEAALESALNQKTQYQYEVVALNTNSTDGSWEILKKYGHRVRAEYYSKMDAATTRNRLLDLAQGEYITYLDADDVLSEDAVEKWLSAAYREQADLVQASYYTFDNRGVIEHFNQGNHIIERFNEENFQKFPGFNCMKIFKRQLFTQIKFPKDYAYEDTLLAFLIYPQVRTAVSLSDELYGYRQHPNSFSRKPGKSVIDTYWIVEQLFLDAQEQQIAPHYLNHLLTYQLGPMLYSRMRGEDQQNLQAVFQLACELKNQLPVLENDTNPFFVDLQRAFSQRNFKLWKLSAATL